MLCGGPAQIKFGQVMVSSYRSLRLAEFVAQGVSHLHNLPELSAIRRSDLARIQLQPKTDHFHAEFRQLSHVRPTRTIVRHWAPEWEAHVRTPPASRKENSGLSNSEGSRKQMTLSSLQAQVPRVILSGFSPIFSTSMSCRQFNSSFP